MIVLGTRFWLRSQARERVPSTTAGEYPLAIAVISVAWQN
jgi:hypothetical protein